MEACAECSAMKPMPSFTQLANLADHFVGNLVVMRMTPPEQHVGVVQHLVGQAVLRLVQRGGADGHVLVLAQKFRNGGVDAVGINGLDFRHFLFVAEFVPYGNADHRYSSLHKRDLISLYRAFREKYSEAFCRMWNNLFHLLVDAQGKNRVSWEQKNQGGREIMVTLHPGRYQYKNGAFALVQDAALRSGTMAHAILTAHQYLRQRGESQDPL